MYLLGRPCGFTIIPSAIFCASRRFRFKKSFICSFSNPNASAISRFVFPASFISRISFSKSLMCVYFLLDIMTPLDVLLLSYIKGCFVYCPFLLVQFSRTLPGLFAHCGRHDRAETCGSGGRVCPGGEQSHAGWNAGRKAAVYLHNIVNCAVFMLISLLAMWKSGFHNADFALESRQPVQLYPYMCRNVRICNKYFI